MVIFGSSLSVGVFDRKFLGLKGDVGSFPSASLFVESTRRILDLG